MRPKQFELEWRAIRHRPQKVAAAILVDGYDLLDQIEQATQQSFDVASPLGWATDEYQLEFLNRLLLVSPPKLATGRREILVCPECADLFCGCISADIRRENDFIVWSNLGYENDYDPAALDIFSMGELAFLEAEYFPKLRRMAPSQK